MRKKETERLKRKLIEQRRILAGDLNHMEEEVLHSSGKESSGDLSSTPFHLADISSETYEQEFTLGLIEDKGKAIELIDKALEKIEEGAYGICEECDNKINVARLTAIPFVRLCVKCKEKKEKGYS